MEEFYTCLVCKQKIKIYKHIISYHLQKHHSFPKKEAFLLQTKIKYKLNDVDISQIVADYDSGYSLPELKNKLNLSLSTLHMIINIKSKTRDIKTSNSKKEKLEKFKTTCLRKYNVDNVSKLQSVKEKKSKTFMENYGVDNIFKDENFINNLNNLMVEKYGVKRIIPVLNFQPLTEKRIKDILIQYNIKHCYSFYLEGRQYDFLLPDRNLIIEINGDFWHANPKIYNEEDILNHPKKFVKAKNLWKKDEIKKNIAIKNGYKILYIWESDLKNLTDLEIFDIISSYENC